MLLLFLRLFFVILAVQDLVQLSVNAKHFCRKTGANTYSHLFPIFLIHSIQLLIH